MAETKEKRLTERALPPAKRQRLDEVLMLELATSRGATDVREIVWHIDSFQLVRKSKKLLAVQGFNITAGVSIGLPCTWKMSLTLNNNVEKTVGGPLTAANGMQPKPTRGWCLIVNRKLVAIPEFVDKVYSQCVVKMKTETMTDFVSVEPVSVFDSQCFTDTVELNLLCNSYNEIMEKLAQDDHLTLHVRLTVYNFNESLDSIKRVNSNKIWMHMLTKRILDSTAFVRACIKKARKGTIFSSDQSSTDSEGIPEDFDSVMENQSVAKGSAKSESWTKAASNESLFETQIDGLPTRLPKEDTIESVFLKVQRWLQTTAPGAERIPFDY